MKKFQIEIEEISQRVEEVEANNIEEALEIVEEKYSNEEIVLDYEDFKGYEVREYRDGVLEEDLVKDNIIDINFGKAIILEKEKDYALIKKIGVKECPYVVTTGLGVNKNKTFFEWVQGSYHNSLAEASKIFEEKAGINKNKNDVIFDELGETTLENYNISKFENVDQIFNFLMDDDINKEELINMLSDEMKKELVLGYVDSVREENGYFYFGQDMYFSEEDINEKARKIDKIMAELNIKNIQPYTVIELLEQHEIGKIDEKLNSNIQNLIQASGYEKTTNDFLNYIIEELENEEESEEGEELE